MHRESRKIEHIRHALQQSPKKNAFDDIILIHNPITEVNYDEVSLNTHIGGLTLSSPLFINAMTGGAKETQEINRQLAMIAKHHQLPLAVGSQMAAIKNDKLRTTYAVVREVYPEGLIIANLGQEATVEQAKQAIEMIEANALQIHINVMQELIMPEGDRDFSGLLTRISHIVKHVSVPVIVKEVGFGMSREAVRQLKEIGVKIVDVGGKGGTNFAVIENLRGGNRYSFLNEWGIPTSISLLEANQVDGLEIIGSGGIRSGLDIVKAIALGARAVGMAGVLLRKLHTTGVEGTIDYIDELKGQIRLIMTAIGAKKIDDIRHVPVVITGKTREWCEVRGISIYPYAQR